MAREHVSDSVHKEHRIGELPRETLLIFIVQWAGRKLSFLLLPNSSARKMAEEPPVKY